MGRGGEAAATRMEPGTDLWQAEEGAEAFGISHEWIYQHVLADKRAGGDLYKHLRCQKKRRKRYGTYNRRGKLLNCRSIEERPAIVNHRKRLGDWEVDTMFGKDHKQAFVTLTERKSRFTLLGKVTQRTCPGGSGSNLPITTSCQRQGPYPDLRSWQGVCRS